VDAYRDDGKRFIVRADDKLTAFMELETAIKTKASAGSPARGFRGFVTFFSLAVLPS
jgi:hypothetical protein